VASASRLSGSNYFWIDSVDRSPDPGFELRGNCPSWVRELLNIALHNFTSNGHGRSGIRPACSRTLFETTEGGAGDGCGTVLVFILEPRERRRELGLRS
jgi:hypothetical protein